MPKSMTINIHKRQVMTERIEHPQHPKAYIYKQPKSQNWFMDYRNSNGKRTRRTTKTDDQNEALALLSENLILIKKVKSGEISITDDADLLVRNAVTKTIKFFDSTKPQKQIHDNYKRELRYFAEQYGHLKLSRITTGELRTYLSQGYSKSRLGMIRTALTTMFRTMKESNHINTIPDFPSRISYKPQEKRKGLKKEQVQALIERFYNKWKNGKQMNSSRRAKDIEKENARIIYLMIRTLYESGARIGEIEELKPRDLAYEKVNRENRAYLNITKSKTRIREILIPVKIYFDLIVHVSEEKIGDNENIFKNRITNPKKTNYTQIIQRDMKHNKNFYDKIGLKSFCLYQLRHTFIIERLKAKKSIYDVAQYCGTSVEVIQKHYGDYIVNSTYSNIHSKNQADPRDLTLKYIDKIQAETDSLQNEAGQIDENKPILLKALERYNVFD